MRRMWTCALVLVMAAAGCSTGAASSDPPPLRIGALYPLSGSQGPGGISEYRGVKTAVEQVNARGGVDGRPIRLVPVDVPGADAVPEAMDYFASHGIRFVLGSYGSTISVPASRIAGRKGMLFWESGAVGERTMTASVRGAYQTGTTSFRVAPTGMTLGANAIRFIARRIPHRGPLRVALTGVDDVYGRSVIRGAMGEIKRLGLHLAASLHYDPRRFSAARIVRRIARSSADVLFSAAYLDDGVAIVRQLHRQEVPLLTAIGTSSSFCLPRFGRRLGPQAVGLFASDKPDADAVEPSALSRAGAAALSAGKHRYRESFGGAMGAPALAGYSAAWALFHYAMPRAQRLTPQAVAAAARRLSLPQGTLPNGSGLSFVPAVDGYDNRAALGVIWEWFGATRAAVVWPHRYATSRLVLSPIK